MWRRDYFLLMTLITCENGGMGPSFFGDFSNSFVIA